MEAESSPAGLAGRLWPGWQFDLRYGHGEAKGQFDFGLEICDGHLGGGRQEAIVADFHEPGRQDVLEETADELQGVEDHGPQPSAAGFFVGEGDPSVLDLEDAVIRDSHLEDVGSEIGDRSLGTGYGLAVDVPVLLPGLRGDLIEQSGGVHEIAELAAEKP